MLLYICEKPSQARDIAKVLGVSESTDGHIVLRNGDKITWSIGHMLEQLMPDEIDPALKAWSWNTLPIIPDAWQYKPVADRERQLKHVGRLLKVMKPADTVVIATDAGREGELIGRELLDYFGYDGPVQRLWLRSLMPGPIRKAAQNLLDGSETEPLYEAALARQQADWLVGMNLSRAASLAADSNVPVGRVQSAALSLVVERCRAIENFRPVDYFELKASITTEKGHSLTMIHSPPEESRILDRQQAEALAAQATSANAPLQVEKKDVKEAPPLPHSLATLQSEASRLLNLSLQETLEIAQALYEAKLITYPRTDCSELPEEMKGEIPAMLQTIAETLPDAVASLEKMGTVFRNKVFNDAKITDHHGLVPTTRSPGQLTGGQAAVYRLIALRLLQSIAPDREVARTKVQMDANGVLFGTSGRVIKFDGWGGLAA